MIKAIKASKHLDVCTTAADHQLARASVIVLHQGCSVNGNMFTASLFTQYIFVCFIININARIIKSCVVLYAKLVCCYWGIANALDNS